MHVIHTVFLSYRFFLLTSILAWIPQCPDMQAHSQKIFLGSIFEEKVDLLVLYDSPLAVEKFTIVWCKLIAYIYEGLTNHGKVI